MQPSVQRPARGFTAFLLFTACLTGALVMAVEVLGARVIAPFFGVSLFVWTALIAVTLLALASGYVVGGRWADRADQHATAGLLYGLIGAAGVLLLLVPWARAPVLQAVLPLGLRSGALVGAFLLFSPPLFLLGCVSPLLVRLAASEWSRLGRTVGLMYAVSTAGSFFGTLITGYYLVAEWGVSRAFLVGGLVLLALAASYFVLFRRRVMALAMLLPPTLLLAFSASSRDISVRLEDGTQARVIDSHDSFYGRVQVVEYRGGAGHTREMIIDGLVQGGIDVASGLSVYEYGYMLEHLALAANPKGRRCLVIGLGPGVVARRFAERGIDTEVVDIDPVVVSAAQKHFGLPASQRVHLHDARYFLASSNERYDYIVLDVFSGDTTPGHLLTREALALVRARLAPDGVLALNMIGNLGANNRMSASVVRTLETVFPWVRVQPVFVPGEGDGVGNIAIVAGLGAPLAELPPLDMRRVHPLAQALLQRALAPHYGPRGYVVARPGQDALILTDDYNPIDVLDLPLKEAVRLRILQSTPAAILLSRQMAHPAV